MAEVGKTMNSDGPAHDGVEIDEVTGQPHHRPRLGRHPRTQPPAAALVAVDVLRHHRVRGGLGRALSGDPAAARRQQRRARLLHRGENVESDIALARQAQAGRLDEIANQPLEEIKANADLDRFAVSGGRSAFLVNCIHCHGTGAAGSRGYPNLNDDDWLWGGTLDDIYHTIAYGIRSDHPDTRYSEMPPFGDILTREQIVAVANYVLALSGKPHDAALVEEGKTIYNDPANCVSCHGEGGVGDRTVGAPKLSDAIALKAGTLDEIVAQIENPKHGVMPAWSGRLSDTVVKELALYVYSLGGGEAATAAQ